MVYAARYGVRIFNLFYLKKMPFVTEGSKSMLRGSGTEQIRNDQNHVVVNMPIFIARNSQQFCVSVDCQIRSPHR